MASKLTLMRPRLKPMRFVAAPSQIDDPIDRERARHSERDKTYPWRAWYKTAEWQALRLRVLERDGYRCRQTSVPLSGKHPAHNSPVVDHIRPHRGDPALFWDENNLQSVSKEWHDSVKQARERAPRLVRRV